ncbi:DUF3365 domain-containing protein [Roseiconus nitratireducens]|uniref:DUF3365 domain-containing protein n=1 Tax=Roseiconus nitratireducens TaxID=2605748 RepID=A0A5M6CX09_9BACT|nr:DUF3365 domain-containing protein [Roseiconus nitratireducens]KAA5539764.1 DUF3365 domain-containing protein [Roseiconus nitratireducens]
MNVRTVLVFTAILCGIAWTSADDDPSAIPATEETYPTNSSEARSRARLLHELVHGTLQIMHRDFFDEDNAHAIPSASLEDVFHEMADRFQVKMKWLIVNTDVVNVDHEAKTKFEEDAVKALAAGKPFVEQTTEGLYRFVGPIRLGSQCLKCHVKRRTDNRDRTAGLVITMPLNDRSSISASSVD